MDMNIEIAKNIIKFGLAITSIFHPEASLLEPATETIFEIIKSKETISKYEIKISKELNISLKNCIKDTLELISNKATKDTQKKSAKFLDWYFETQFRGKNLQIFLKICSKK